MSDYIRDLRPAKRGSKTSLHGGNSEPFMSALGQKRTLELSRENIRFVPEADIAYGAGWDAGISRDNELTADCPAKQRLLCQLVAMSALGQERTS